MLLPDVMQVALARRKYPRETALLKDLSSRLDGWTAKDGSLSDVVASKAPRFIDIQKEALDRMSTESEWQNVSLPSIREREAKLKAAKAKQAVAEAKLAKEAREKQAAEDARATAKARAEAEAADAAAARAAAAEAKEQRRAAAAEAEAKQRSAAAEYSSLVQAHTFTVDVARLPPPLALADAADRRVGLAEELAVLLQQLVSEALLRSLPPPHASLALLDALQQQHEAEGIRRDGGTLDPSGVRPGCAACCCSGTRSRRFDDSRDGGEDPSRLFHGAASGKSFGRTQ